jgi:hypothetical protein
VHPACSYQREDGQEHLELEGHQEGQEQLNNTNTNTIATTNKHDCKNKQTSD